MRNTVEMAEASRSSGKLYFSAADGSVWRVHDCVFERGGFRRVATASARATSRVFVAANGLKRSPRFTRGESRERTESRLEAQLQKAGYPGSEKFDAKGRDAR